ncbi:MAG: NAD(P)/FAD-dependent oxidoreductase [Prolixibacteraceae bacterium]|jgi:all-trans-retinol 13,14-reductase|nr:NAD(P)/FAD-dependent oxidoreductase [Prolixibacteraceae bacterium]
MNDYKYDTIVVGGGIAGLTSTAYLARAGEKVLLIEKNDKCGGLVNSFSRNGFQYDAGVRALEDAGIILPMLENLGIKLETVKSSVSVGIGKDIIHIKDRSSLNDYRKLLIKHYPESENEIDQILKEIKTIMKHMDVLYGIENPFFKDLKSDLNYIFKKLLPWLPKFIFTIGKINRMNIPVEDHLKTIIKNDSLRDIISQHFFKSTPTFFALSYFSLYLDYFYPKGGVGKLADVVKNKALELGGEISLKTSVTKVNANNNTLTDNKGIVYEYDQLIWAADAKYFYNNTQIDLLKPKVKEQFEATKSKLISKRGSDSVFTLFLQVDEPLESFKAISSGHFFYTPSKKGLGEIYRSELNHMLENWNRFSKEQVLEWLDRYISLNTFEISIPGLKDPDLVPENKSGVVISFLSEYFLFKKVQDSGWYEEFIAEIEKRTIELITNSVYPMLKDKVIGKFTFTPLSIQNRVASSEGSIIGWSFESPVPVINNIQKSAKSILTPIPNIFQAGQWTYSPAGVPMSILTGKLAADAVLKNK